MRNLHLKVNKDIELKIPKMGDIIPVFLLVLENKKWLARYLSWVDNIKTPIDIKDYFEKNSHKSFYDLDFPLMIWYQKDIVGIISYARGNKVKKEVEIGYWISEEHSGKGIITLSTKSLINFAFSMTDIQSILICCEISNIKSYKIPQKLGFEFIKEEEGVGYSKNSKPVKLTYKLIKESFEKNKKFSSF